MENQENLLLSHIRAFRRKYYINQIIRGSIFLLLISSSLFFFAVLSEGMLGLSSGVRTGLMAFLGLSFVSVLGYYVLWPASKLLKISQPISDEHIARIVSKHFPEIDDKLLNLLQLKAASDGVDNSLLVAAIEKKTEELAPVPFARAINLNVNLRYARYLAIPALLFLLIWGINPDILADGSRRLINFNEEFLPPAPFSIILGEQPRELVEGGEFDLSAELTGDEFPEELYVYLKNESGSGFVNYPMSKLKNNAFNFKLSDLKEDFEFFVGNEEVRSDKFGIEVLRRPAIRGFNVVVDYPDYTGIPSDTLSDNIGDFKVLKGSKVQWLVLSNMEIEEAKYIGGDTADFMPDAGSGMLKRQKQVMLDENYYISLKSKRGITNTDTVQYHIDVLQDRYPSVYLNKQEANFQADFTMKMPLDFEVSDDYGFSNLSLFYRFTESEQSDKVKPEYESISLNIKRDQLLQHKALEMDLLNLGMEEGDVVEYFIRVWDNDYVSGPKASSSSLFTVNYPSLNKKFEEVDENQDELKKDLAEAEKSVSEVKEAFEKFQEKMLNQRKLSYDDKRELQKLLDKQKSASEKIEDIQEKYQENKEYLENNNLISEETLEKYEQLNKLVEELKNPELEAMMEKMQEQMEKLDPKELKKMMEEAQFDEEELEKNLERTMELLKSLEIEQKQEEIEQKLDNMKMKQDLLNEKLEETKKNDDAAMKDIAEKQEELEKEMDGVKEDLEELKEMKDDTQTPDGEKMDELMKNANDGQQEMNKAGDQIQQQQKNQGSQSQKKASEKLQQMQESLQSMSMSSQQQQDQANLEDLRDLLENLLKLSFKQEDLRDEVKDIRSNDPQLFVKEAEQKQLQDDMYMVKDSLDELAKKVFQIEKFITDESQQILKSMKRAQVHLDNKQITSITREQHSAMTHINNLANMLTDVMQQMQQQMQNQMSGSGSCTKPSNGKPSLKNLGKQQGELNKQMMQMLKSGKGMNGKKLAEMAAQQEALRKALKDAHQKIGEGDALGDLQRIMKDMKDTETELRNKQLTRETMKRQQQILNRLLDSFKAVREKEEFEDTRRSRTGNDTDRVSPDQLEMEEYKNRIRQELLKSNQLEYSSDFIILIEKYFKLLEKANEQ